MKLITTAIKCDCAVYILFISSPLKTGKDALIITNGDNFSRNVQFKCIVADVILR